MRIPRKIRSQGLVWHIRFTDDIADLGFTDYEKQEILIRKSVSQELKEAIFIHEIGHTINSTIDHTLLDSLSMQFYQVLKDNNLISI